jgi:hypothetical protein
VLFLYFLILAYFFVCCFSAFCLITRTFVRKKSHKAEIHHSNHRAASGPVPIHPRPFVLRVVQSSSWAEPSCDSGG